MKTKTTLMTTVDMDLDGYQIQDGTNRALTIHDLGFGETLVVETNGDPVGLSDDCGESARDIVNLMISDNSGQSFNEVRDEIIEAVNSSCEERDLIDWIVGEFKDLTQNN